MEQELQKHLKQYESIGVKYVVDAQSNPLPSSFVKSPRLKLAFSDRFSQIYMLPDAAPLYSTGELAGLPGRRSQALLSIVTVQQRSYAASCICPAGKQR